MPFLSVSTETSSKWTSLTAKEWRPIGLFVWPSPSRCITDPLHSLRPNSSPNRERQEEDPTLAAAQLPTLPDLPLELIHHIISLVDDDPASVPTKARLCLLAKSTLHAARAALYRHVIIDFDEYGPRGSPDGTSNYKLYIALNTNPALGAFVKNLVVTLNDANEFISDFREMSGLIELCSPLKALDIRAQDQDDEDDILGVLSYADADEIRLEELSVASLGNGCYEFLESRPTLKRLVFRGPTGEDTVSNRSRTAPPLFFPFRLTSLVTPPEFDPRIFHALVYNSTSSLRHLTISTYLLTQIPNLKRLTRFAERPLSLLTSLISLTIICDDFDFAIAATNPLSFFASTPALHTLRFAVQHGKMDDDFPESDLFEALPVHIQHLHFDETFVRTQGLLDHMRSKPKGLRSLHLSGGVLWGEGTLAEVEEACEEQGVQLVVS